MLLSSALDALYHKVQEMGKQKFWLSLVLLFIFVVFINGVGIVPEEPYQRLSQNPFITRTDIHFNNYWQETLLLPLLAYYLGFTGTITFNVLVSAMIIGAYLLFASLIHRHQDSTMALITSILLITSPLTTVLLSWLGTPDGLTVALTVPFLFTHSSTLILFLAFLGAANHPAFIVAVLELLILRRASQDGIDIKYLIFATIGIILGYGAVKLFLFSHNIDVVSRIDFIQMNNLSSWIRINTENLPSTVFSLFNIHWLVLPVCMIMFFNKDRRFFSLVASLLMINYTIVFFTLDTTRVFILTSWAVLFMCILHSYKLASLEIKIVTGYQKQFLQALMLIGIISLFAPRYFSWVGEIHMTPFYKLVSHLIQ